MLGGNFYRFLFDSRTECGFLPYPPPTLLTALKLRFPFLAPLWLLIMVKREGLTSEMVLLFPPNLLLEGIECYLPCFSV